MLRFYPETSDPPVIPLARFLPPLPGGMVRSWLQENILPGSWLLDPLGASPTLALEAAQAGYRVLVASNNPIIRFMIEVLASAPKASDFQAALAEIAMSKRGDERLEKHLYNLYLTECETCGERIPAHTFLWRKGETQPYGKIYRCPKCGESPGGERPITQFDLGQLNEMGRDRLQRVRALQRVIPNDSEQRENVEEVLETYLARPLYVLFTLLNKIEGLGQSPDRVRLLQALLLSACDAGNSLWAWPGGRARPRQLSSPSQFREINLWQYMEDAISEWTKLTEPIQVTSWPDRPANLTPGKGTICLFHGRVKTLMPLPVEVVPQAVLTVFPRPSQAFWTYSVLWSGWLWGPEAALPIRNVLDRRRYDWNWYTSAIFSAFSGVGNHLNPGTPFFGLLPELVPGFLNAALCANQAAGFQVEGIALRIEQEIAQVSGHIFIGENKPEQATAKPDPSPLQELDTLARDAMRENLLERGEPAPYLALYAAGLHALIRGGAVGRAANTIPGDLFTRLQALLIRIFSDRAFLHLYGGPVEESGWWWLANPPQGAPLPLRIAAPPGKLDKEQLPLADQVEIEAVRFIHKNVEFSLDELDRTICRRFPGLLTPSKELVTACLESYAEPIPRQPEKWRLSPRETAVARKADLQEMRKALFIIGEKLGYQVIEREGMLTWEGREMEGRENWLFFRMASSIISRFVFPVHPPDSRHVALVLPGSRARLLKLKLHRNPRLAEAASRWRFLKFRHLRDIAAHPDIDAALWEALVDEDPLTETAHQMELFS